MHFLSFLVAAAAFYAAFDLASRVHAGKGTTSGSWLTGAGVVMGTGVWSAHFIGMLSLGAETEWLLPGRTLASLLAGVAASVGGLWVLHRAISASVRIPAAGALIGGALAVAHHLAMWSARTAISGYDASLAGVSILVAVSGASLAAGLYVRSADAPTRRAMGLRAASALVLAATFVAVKLGGGRTTPLLAPAGAGTAGDITGANLAGIIALGIPLVIGVALFASTFDRTIATSSRKERPAAGRNAFSARSTGPQAGTHSPRARPDRIHCPAAGRAVRGDARRV